MAASPVSDQQQLAFSILASGRIARASPWTRSRRRCEIIWPASVRAVAAAGGGWCERPVVQCNMGIVQNWDTHGGDFGKLRTACCRRSIRGLRFAGRPRRDRQLDALVVMLGEFGRTPPSRRRRRRRRSASLGALLHGVFAGAGVRRADHRPLGRDRRYPATTPFARRRLTPHRARRRPGHRGADRRAGGATQPRRPCRRCSRGRS